MNQRLERVVECLKAGDLVEAQDLINMELDERADTLKSKVTEAVTSNIFESMNSKTVKGLGKVVVKPKGAYIEDVNSFDVAFKLAPNFAKFANGASGKYTAKSKGDGETITISLDGREAFDIFYNEGDNTLSFEGDFSKGDIERFRKTGRLDEGQIDEAMVTFDMKGSKSAKLIDLITDVELSTKAVAKRINGSKVTYDKKDESTVKQAFNTIGLEEGKDYTVSG